RLYPAVLANFRFSPRRGRAPAREKEPVQGTFEFINVSDTGEQIVALETGWKKDLKKMTNGMAGYADFYKPGIDDMEAEAVYGCKVGDTWKRCRMMSRHGLPGNFLVELIDFGGSMTVTRSEVLSLSQLYKDWSIKSVDVFFTDYSVESGAEVARELSALLLNNSFQLVYTHERTGPLMRDRIFVTEMKRLNENVLDKLIQKGLLKKQLHQRLQQQSERPLSQQGLHTKQRHERFPLRSQRPITKCGQGPQQADARSPRLPYEESMQGTGDSKHQFEPQISPPTDNGWGDLELRDGDTGVDCWASLSSDRAGKKHLDWNDQRENQDPQTSWSTAKQWAASDWEYSSEPAQRTSTATPGRPVNKSPQYEQSESRQVDPGSEWGYSPEPAQGTPPQPSVRPASKSPQYQQKESRSTCTNQTESPRSHRQESRRRTHRPAQAPEDDVFSSADDWTKPAQKESPRDNELHRRVEELTIAGGNSPSECERCIQLTNKVNTLESQLYGPAVQQLISTRLTNISAELRQVKVHLAQLRLDPTAQETDVGRAAFARCRREGRIRVKEVEDLLTTSSAETLRSFGMTGWSQFVGVIWKPMMDLQYLDERPLCVYKSTVIRRVVLEDDTEDAAVDPTQQPPQNFADQVTVLLERAIEIPKMFPVLQNLAPNLGQSRVHSVFFSEVVCLP
ncbi:hypothetical protein BIW11_07006, partial [Tropilaelaps mercedesae]